MNRYTNGCGERENNLSVTGKRGSHKTASEQPLCFRQRVGGSPTNWAPEVFATGTCGMQALEEARLVQLVGAGQSHDGASIVEAVKAHHAIVRRPRKNKSSAARNRGAAIAGRRARAEDTWKRHIRSTDRMRKHRTPTDVSRKKTWLQDTGSRNKQEETRKLGWRLLQNTLWGPGGPRSLRATDVIWQTCTNKCKSREWKRAHGRARTFPTKLA